MKTMYRIIMTATFDNQTDRNTWYDKLKTNIIASKGALPVWDQAHMTKDEYMTQEKDTETL